MKEKENVEKMGEVTSFLKLPVYTRNGTYVGHVKNDVELFKDKTAGISNLNISLITRATSVLSPLQNIRRSSPITQRTFEIISVESNSFAVYSGSICTATLCDLNLYIVLMTLHK